MRIGIDQPTLVNGLVFTNKGRLTVTSKQVLVTAQLSSLEILDPPELLRKEAYDLKTIMEREFSQVPHFRLLLDNLRHATSVLIDTQRNLRDFIIQYEEIPRSRTKRGAVNFIGDVAHVLFGLATDSQVQVIANNLENIHKMTEEQRRLLNLHTKLLNETVRDMSLIRKAQTRMEKAVNLTKTIIGEIATSIRHINEEAYINAALDNVNALLNDVS